MTASVGGGSFSSTGTESQLIGSVLSGMGYELVEVERSRLGLLRVFIDAPAGITLKDCEAVSRQLSYVLSVEAVEYSRLEVSSPGLDRLLRSDADFLRFLGAKATVLLRLPLEGRRRFSGVLVATGGRRFGLDSALLQVAAPLRKKRRKSSVIVDGALPPCTLLFTAEDVQEARLLPDVAF